MRSQGVLQALRAQKVSGDPLHWAPETQNTSDLQMVNITCRVLSRPSPQALPTIYRELGQDFDERVLPSIVNEVLKSVVAQFNASQLITQREMVLILMVSKEPSMLTEFCDAGFATHTREPHKPRAPI